MASLKKMLIITLPTGCHDLENIRLISIDTVNPHGGWQGSIDEKQLNWIREKLLEAKDKYCVLLSHHPSPTLINDFAPAGQCSKKSN
jgi:hypothetical protein